MAKKKSPINQLTYKDALDQLETIVTSLEEEELDIDALSDKVKEAMDLMKFCKEKLRTTEDSLNQAFEEEN